MVERPFWVELGRSACDRIPGARPPASGIFTLEPRAFLLQRTVLAFSVDFMHFLGENPLRSDASEPLRDRRKICAQMTAILRYGATQREPLTIITGQNIGWRLTGLTRMCSDCMERCISMAAHCCTTVSIYSIILTSHTIVKTCRKNHGPAGKCR